MADVTDSGFRSLANSAAFQYEPNPATIRLPMDDALQKKFQGMRDNLKLMYDMVDGSSPAVKENASIQMAKALIQNLVQCAESILDHLKSPESQELLRFLQRHVDAFVSLVDICSMFIGTMLIWFVWDKLFIEEKMLSQSNKQIKEIKLCLDQVKNFVSLIEQELKEIENCLRSIAENDDDLSILAEKFDAHMTTAKTRIDECQKALDGVEDTAKRVTDDLQSNAFGLHYCTHGCLVGIIVSLYTHFSMGYTKTAFGIGCVSGVTLVWGQQFLLRNRCLLAELKHCEEKHRQLNDDLKTVRLKLDESIAKKKKLWEKLLRDSSE